MITGTFDNDKIYYSQESRSALRFTLTSHGLSGLLTTFSEVNRCAILNNVHVCSLCNHRVVS